MKKKIELKDLVPGRLIINTPQSIHSIFSQVLKKSSIRIFKEVYKTDPQNFSKHHRWATKKEVEKHNKSVLKVVENQLKELAVPW